MIERRPFSYDRETGIYTTFCFDHTTERVTFEKSQDAEPLTEINKLVSLETPGNWKGDMHKVASLPLHVWMELKQQGVIDDQKRFKAWLNERDNAAFRTRTGRI